MFVLMCAALLCAGVRTGQVQLSKLPYVHLAKLYVIKYSTRFSFSTVTLPLCAVLNGCSECEWCNTNAVVTGLGMRWL